jgi:protein subunit release factor B
MIVTKSKLNQLHKRMKALNIYESDLFEKFILGSGTGGQKINKTSSCVFLKHIPSGIHIKCQVTRSREYNRYLAITAICDRLEEKAAAEIQEKIQLREKIRRQNKKRSFSGQMKVMEEKKRRSANKKFRGKSKDHD